MKKKFKQRIFSNKGEKTTVENSNQTESIMLQPVFEQGMPLPSEKTVVAENYETILMEMKELKERKAIYISKELHQEITHILGTIKSGELSVGAYIENIINHHIGVYKEDIDSLYESRFKKPSQRFNK